MAAFSLTFYSNLQLRGGLNGPDAGFFSFWGGSYWLSAGLSILLYGLATPGYRPGKKRKWWQKVLYCLPIFWFLVSAVVLYALCD